MAIKTEVDLPENLKATWLKALSAMQLKNYGYAIQLVQAVLKAVPEFLPGRQLARKAAIARSSMKKGLLSGLSTSSFSGMKAQSLLKKDPKAAIEAVEKILENEPFNPTANNLLKEAALVLNMTETATFALETIVQGNPKDTKTMHDLARHLLSVDLADQAVEVYNKILTVNPQDLAAVKGSKDASAKASMLRGGWAKEENTYRDLIKNRDEAISLEQKSRVVHSIEMIEQQLAELHKQIEEQPDSIDLSRKIAEFYEQKEDYGSAAQWYDYAAQLTGGADLALVRKASDLRLREFDIALEQWQEYIASNPGAEEAASAGKQIEELRKQRSGIQLEEARKRVNRNPSDLQFRYELGEILLQQGQPQEAIPELQKARQSPNVRSRALNLLGQCYEVRGMLDLAVKTLSDTLGELPAMDSLKKDILYRLGILHDKMENKEQYIACMKQIYEVDYSYRDVAARVEGSYAE